MVVERRKRERDSLDSITLADVKYAVMILEEFVRQVSSVRSVLNRYYSLYDRMGVGYGVRRPEDLVGLLLAQSMLSNIRQSGEGEVEEYEVEGEELEKAKERLRSIAERERKKLEGGGVREG